MHYIEKSLLVIAYISKILKLPHLLKYGLFLLIKKRQIPIRSSINISYAKMDLNLGNFIDYWIFMDGSYEGKWQMQVREFVKGKTFIDIGSNIGIYPLTLYKETKFIYAFEPEKKNYKRLLHNLKINSIKNVKAFKLALGKQVKNNATLHISKDDHGWHSLSIHYTNGIQKVNVLTLDAFIKKNNLKDIGLIKIDVEGAEYDVVRGSQNTLKKLHPNLLIEFNKPYSNLAGQKLIALYKLIIDNHYQCFRMTKAGLTQTNESYIEKIYNENLLFIYHE